MEDVDDFVLMTRKHFISQALKERRNYRAAKAAGNDEAMKHAEYLHGEYMAALRQTEPFQVV